MSFPDLFHSFLAPANPPADFQPGEAPGNASLGADFAMRHRQLKGRVFPKRNLGSENPGIAGIGKAQLDHRLQPESTDPELDAEATRAEEKAKLKLNKNVS